MELKELLREKAAKSWDTTVDKVSDIDLAMEFIYEQNVIEESDHDEHRWYTTYLRVAKVDDIFISFQTYSNSGDENAFDGDEHAKMILKGLVQVFPKRKEVTVYVTKDQL